MPVTGKARSPLPLEGAWAETSGTSETSGIVPGVVLCTRNRLAGFAQANCMERQLLLCTGKWHGAQARPCHIPEVSEVPEVSARPPSNGIPCGRPAHSQRHPLRAARLLPAAPLAGGPPIPSGPQVN